MSVVSVSDSPERGGGWVAERRGPIYELNVRRYKRTQVVVTNDIADGPEVILVSGMVPALGDTYALGNDSDAIAVCVDVNIERTASPFVWHAVSTYDSSRTVDIALSNPLNLPTEITWSFRNYEYALLRDGRNIPIANSARERFDPPMTIEDSRPVLTVSRNEASYNQTNAILYQNAVNADVFGPAQPFQAKMTSISAQRMVDIGIVYYKVNYEIEFRAQTFAFFALDQGYRDYNGRLFRDPVDGTALANATLLNGRGYRLVDTYCRLDGAVIIADQQIKVKNPASFAGATTPKDYFPPGPGPGNAHWYFEVLIDSEIMQVTGGFGTDTWNVTRGYAGTTAANHADLTTVTLQPYYLRFLPFNLQRFAPLNLPTV